MCWEAETTTETATAADSGNPAVGSVITAMSRVKQIKYFKLQFVLLKHLCKIFHRKLPDFSGKTICVEVTPNMQQAGKSTQ